MSHEYPPAQQLDSTVPLYQQQQPQQQQLPRSASAYELALADGDTAEELLYAQAAAGPQHNAAHFRSWLLSQTVDDGNAGSRRNSRAASVAFGTGAAAHAAAAAVASQANLGSFVVAECAQNTPTTVQEPSTAVIESQGHSRNPAGGTPAATASSRPDLAKTSSSIFLESVRHSATANSAQARSDVSAGHPTSLLPTPPHRSYNTTSLPAYAPPPPPLPIYRAYQVPLQHPVLEGDAAPPPPLRRRVSSARSLDTAITGDASEYETAHFVVDVPAPEKLLQRCRYADSEEFQKLRYTACTVDPDDFGHARYMLRQQLLDRQTELFIVVTMYNEDEVLFCKTISALMRNVAFLCGRRRSQTWGEHGWKKVV
ncbi:Chitin synthase, class 1, partial [Cladochytrium tenue]